MATKVKRKAVSGDGSSTGGSTATEQSKEFNRELRANLRDLVREIRKSIGTNEELDFAALASILDERGCRTRSEQSIRNIFMSTNDTKDIDLFTLVNICDVLGVDIRSVLPERNVSPEIRDEGKGIAKLLWRKDSKYNGEMTLESEDKPLIAEFYTGIYHVYYFAPMVMDEFASEITSETVDQNIKHAKLRIYSDGYKSLAELKEDIKREEMVRSQPPKTELELKGDVRLLAYMNQVYIQLRNCDGHRFMNIMFPYIHLAGNQLYSQVAAVLCVSTEQHRAPCMQKMMICREKLDMQKFENVVRGVLSMNGNQIVVRNEEFKRLQSSGDNEWLKKFYETVSNKDDPFFVFYENDLFSMYQKIGNRMSGGGSQEKYANYMMALMELRNISISSAFYRVEESNRFNLFSAYIQEKSQQS